MKRRSLWLLLGVIGLVALSASSSAIAGKNVTPRTGGTVIYGLDQEPKVLNTYITEGNLFAASEAVEPLLDGGMEYNNRGTLVPVLMAGQPKVVKNNPLTIKFSYKKAAKWNDGKQITGADFRFTWQTIMNKSFDITSRGMGGHRPGQRFGQERDRHVPQGLRSLEAAPGYLAAPAARGAGRELQPGLAERLPQPEERQADLFGPVHLQPLAARLAARADPQPQLLGEEGVPEPDRLPRGLGHEHAVPGDPLG
jgi:hypothetical protein